MDLQALDKGESVLVLTESVEWQTVVAGMKHVKMVVYPHKGAFSAQSPLDPNTHEPRVKIPGLWAAKPREELIKLTGVKDVIMADRFGQWVSARTCEAAVALAHMVVKAAEQPVAAEVSAPAVAETRDSTPAPAVA